MSTVIVFDNSANVSTTGDLILTDGPLYASFTSSIFGTLAVSYKLVLSNPTTSTGSFQAAIYADNAGTPGTIMSVMNVISDTTVTTTTAAVYTFSSGTTPVLTAATRY